MTIDQAIYRAFSTECKLTSIYSIAVLLRDLKLVLGRSGHSCIFGLLKLLLNINNNFCWIIAHLFKLLSVLFSGGSLIEFAFLKDVNIGVTAYCLPEDEIIGEFG